MYFFFFLSAAMSAESANMQAYAMENQTGTNHRIDKKQLDKTRQFQDFKMISNNAEEDVSVNPICLH